MLELIQVTAQYSHAVLVAILPFVSDFATRLDLPVGPVTTNQVVEFKCDPRQGQTGGAITLSNGFQFAFLDGRVSVYRSPQSYFSLQDPEQIARFYGPVKLNEKEALQIALGAIKKLGYENAVFNADSAPLVTSPIKVGTNSIPRYLFRWLDPQWPASKEPGSIVPALLDIEVNANNRAIEMMLINSRETRRPSPKVDVVPPLLHSKAPQKASGGTGTAPVSDAYAKAFLEAILPQLSDFIVKAGLDLPTPVTTNQIVMTNYVCRVLRGQPIAQLYLTNGDRFNYEQGCFSAYYAHDAMDKFPETGRGEDFLGHLNMTTDEAISLCADVIKKLGYSEKLPKPIVSHVPGRGSLVCSRYSFMWRHPGEDLSFASCEVDMETKTIKSIYLKDASFEKPSPKIDAPLTAPPTPTPLR
jgi:hypothetical protein